MESRLVTIQISFTDLRLLSQFSEFFFSYIETAQLNKSFTRLLFLKSIQGYISPFLSRHFFSITSFISWQVCLRCRSPYIPSL